ncbi:MAG: formylglycine-generating enzyme family protein [Treponema sp.]|nr:formylglycine-generating enzyme family protein [Treponema sp.]
MGKIFFYDRKKTFTLIIIILIIALVVTFSIIKNSTEQKQIELEETSLSAVSEYAYSATEEAEILPEFIFSMEEFFDSLPELLDQDNLLAITDILENEDNLEDMEILIYEITQSDFEDLAETSPLQPVIRILRPIPENMVLVRGGTYTMGSPTDEADREEDERLHEVTLNFFYIGMYEVTQREYERVMGNNPSFFKGQNRPVEQVSWFNAVEYCNRLSRMEDLTPAYIIRASRSGGNPIVIWNRRANGYRLPTEEEWEYACRAGTTTAYNTGDNLPRNRANYFGTGTTEVGRYPPNNWGIFDMHGNVAEWCWNWYGDYNLILESHPERATPQDRRVIRGGSYFTFAMRARSAFRDHNYPTYKSINIGFRVVRNYEQYY